MVKRSLIAAALFWLLIALTRPDYRLTWRERGLLAAMGVGGYAVMATLMFSSIYYMSASITELVFYTYPTLVCLLARLIDKEPITARKGIVLAAGFAGLMLVLLGPAGLVSVPGVAMAFAAAIVYAVFILFSNRMVRNVTPLVSSAHISTSSAVALTVCSPPFGTTCISYAIRPPGPPSPESPRFLRLSTLPPFSPE